MAYKLYGAYCCGRLVNTIISGILAILDSEILFSYLFV